MEAADAAVAEGRLRARLCEVSHELDARGAAIALWSLGTRGGELGLAVGKVGERLRRVASKFKPQDVANTLWALAKLHSTPDADAWASLASRAAAVAAEMKTHELSIVIWAVASLGLDARGPLASAWQEAAKTSIKWFSAQSVANSLWALGRLAHAEEPLQAEPLIVDALVSRASQVEWLQPQGLANALAACAALGVEPGTAAALAARADVSQLTGADVGEVAWALGELRLKEPLQPLLQRVRELITLGDLDWQAIGRIGYALDMLGTPGKGFKATRALLADCALKVVGDVNAQRGVMHAAAGELLLGMDEGGPAEIAQPARLLVVDDFKRVVGRALKAKGLHISWWQRFSAKARPGTPWPPEAHEGKYSGAILRLASTRAATELALHAIAPFLAEGAPVWLYGARAEGALNAAGLLRGAGFVNARLVAASGLAAVAQAARSEEDLPAGQLEDWATEDELTLEGSALRWRVLPGLFAGGGLDIMTSVLLKTLPTPTQRARVLDFCCGAGSIAAALRSRTPDLRLTLLDADAVALEAARVNVPDATYFLSDAWASVPDDKRFDWIVSNPPVHCRLQPDFTVLCALLEGAASHLRPGGSLWLVAQVYVPVGQLHGGAALAFTNGRFSVWKIDAET